MLLVRHGETLSNLERRYHGRLDSPLTERGVAQANAIGRQIAALLKGQSAEIVSSPQPRALRTAELIRERLGSTVGPVIIDNRLCEISIGEWESLGHDEIAACAPGIFDGDGRYEWCFSAPGGETYDAFAARIADFLGDIDDAPSLIVVTHGIVARVLRGLYAGLSRSVALALPIPQDRIFRLSEGGIEEIVVEDLKMPRIMTVLALPDRRLFVQFDDGISGTVDPNCCRCSLRVVDQPFSFGPQIMSELQRCPMNSFGADSIPSPTRCAMCGICPMVEFLTSAIGGSC